MIEEYNRTDAGKERAILKALAHQRAMQGRKKMNEDPNAFKEGYTDEHVFQIYGPR